MENGNVVVQLRELLGDDVLLLQCRRGTKQPVGKWKNLTVKAMEDPTYVARLAQGNIGVVLGQRSGGLCSLDIDSDEALGAFSELNEAVCQTLCTRGARGCNFWWKLEGRYPGLTPLTLAGAPWGEWRADGAQTVIWGRHPSGAQYRFLRRMKPLRIDFHDIKWPSGMKPFLNQSSESDDTERTETTQIPQSPQCTQPTERTEDTKANASGGCVPSPALEGFTVDQALAAARPRGPGGNHERLFTLARGVRAVEVAQDRRFSDAELKDIFGRWYADAKPHVKKDLSFDDYWFEFMEGYENVEHPLGAGVLERAWVKAASAAPPVVAEQFQDAKLRQVVGLCRELWLIRERQPFFVSCRTLQRLLGHADHVRAARWLRGLVRSKVLAIEEAGTAVTRKATRYRYLPED